MGNSPNHRPYNRDASAMIVRDRPSRHPAAVEGWKLSRFSLFDLRHTLGLTAPTFATPFLPLDLVFINFHFHASRDEDDLYYTQVGISTLDTRDLWVADNGYLDPGSLIRTWGLSSETYNRRQKMSARRVFGDEMNYSVDLLGDLAAALRIPDGKGPDTFRNIALVDNSGLFDVRKLSLHLGAGPGKFDPVIGIMSLWHLQRDMYGKVTPLKTRLKTLGGCGIQLDDCKRTAGNTSSLTIRLMLLLAVAATKSEHRILGKRKRDEEVGMLASEARAQTLEAIAKASDTKGEEIVRDKLERRAQRDSGEGYMSLEHLDEGETILDGLANLMVE